MKNKFQKLCCITILSISGSVFAEQTRIRTVPIPGDFELGIASYTFREKSLDQVLSVMQKMQVRRLALKSCHLPLDSTDQDIHNVISAVDQSGIEAYAGGVIYMQNEDDVVRAFQYAKAAGFKMIIGVPAPELLDLVEKKVKEYDIRLAVHNHGSRDILYHGPADVYEVIKQRDKRIGMCIDIGHTTRLNLDPGLEIRTYADRVMDVHLWDCSSASYEGKPVLAGYGVVNIKGVLQALIDINYSGTIAVEYAADSTDPAVEAAQTIGYVEGLLNTLQTSKPAANILTQEEQRQGWKLLFDGQTTNGWRGINITKFPETGWSVKDGQLCVVESGGGESRYGGDIITEKKFRNFELRWEWMMLTRGGNSGVKYYVLEGLSKNPKHGEGLEYQILDDANHSWMLAGKMKPGDYRTVGSLYELYAAENKKLMPLGYYNRSWIICRNGHVEHWLNGYKVVEYERISEDFNRRVQLSKFKSIKNFGLADEGHILLQDHGGNVCFRNIKIREFQE